jgi:hypothetical protein
MHLLHLQIFSTGFFEDCIHSTQSLNAQGRVLQYKSICSLESFLCRQPPRPPPSHCFRELRRIYKRKE